MRLFYTTLIILLLTINSFAQSPEGMSYQAIVRDSGNALVTEQPVGVQISILQGSATGTAVYAETHTATTNTNGLLTLVIGTGSTADDFSAIDWANGPYFIKTDTDPTGGTNYSITGTSQLMSVPYALYAKSSGNITIPEGTSPNDILIWSGSEWSLLPIGEEGASLQVVGGVPTWVVPSGGVQFGFQDDFDNLNLDLNQLHSDWVQFQIGNSASALNPNITTLSLLLSTNPNPIPVNSPEYGINISELNGGEFGVGSTSLYINNLESDTTYYYRALINGVFVDENVYSFRTPLPLGINYQGGILAYIYQPNENGYVEGQMHGFVVAESSLTETATWGCEGTHLSGMITGGNVASTAAQNQAIIAGCAEAGIAAKVVDGLTINGYSDWLLPSKDLINNGIRENEVLVNLTGIVDGYYWSCTPHGNNPAQSAWATHINNGSNIQANKSNTYYIIPVREF